MHIFPSCTVWEVPGVACWLLAKSYDHCLKRQSRGQRTAAAGVCGASQVAWCVDASRGLFAMPRTSDMPCAQGWKCNVSMPMAVVMHRPFLASSLPLHPLSPECLLSLDHSSNAQPAPRTVSSSEGCACPEPAAKKQWSGITRTQPTVQQLTA